MNECWGGIDVGTHVIGADSNVGKCLGFDTPVLMFDGSIKPVQDIVPGDRLMGPDSGPRTVLGTTHGYGELHQVIQAHGSRAPYVVNAHHILSVVTLDSREPFNLPVQEYYAEDAVFKRHVRGYQALVYLPGQKVNPDMLGGRIEYHISVEPIGPGEYYGFELDRDGLFLLGDHTVTHNSSLLRMMAWDIVRNNPDVHLRYYTLDDAEDYFFDCYVAQMANIPINSVHKPDAFIYKEPKGYYSRADYQKMVEQGHRQYQLLAESNLPEKFSFIGADRLGDVQWSTIERDIRETRNQIGNKKLVCCVDNFHDIEADGSFMDQNERTETIAKVVDQLAKELDIVMLGTVELKKNQQRRPIIDDIFGSRKWKYKARTVLLLYSEVGVGRPNPRLCFERPDLGEEHAPILEVHFAKSKVSEFKGRLFFQQYTERGTMTEVDQTRAEDLARLIS